MSEGELAARSTATQRSGGAYAWYVVAVLMLAYGASLIDRQILSLMVGPVRADLGLTDTQLSFLHGLAFALFYTGFGIPLGWIADHGNRRWLIFAGLLVWGAATVWCGLANSFAMLFAARMAVGMGEAALSPAAYSMIHDYFDAETRGRAMSLYGIGVFLGAGAAYIVGGAAVDLGGAGVEWLRNYGLDLKPWQFVFVLVGSISLVLLLMVTTVREPPRREVRRPTARATEAETVVAGESAHEARAAERGATFATITRGSGPLACIHYTWTHRWLHGTTILGLSIGAIVFNGLFAWVPSHFIRVFGWSASEIGLAFGLVLLVFGTGGMWSGGYFADIAAKAGRRDGAIRVVFWGETVGGASAVLFGFASTTSLGLALLCVCVFCFGAAIAMGPVALQEVTPSPIRSQMIALYLFIVNVLGLGLGPSLIAGTSDYILQDEMAIGRAVSLVAALVMPLAAAALFSAKRRYA